MDKIIFPLLIGLMYGAGFYIIDIKTFHLIRAMLLRSIKPHSKNRLVLCALFFPSISSILLGGGFLFSVLFFRPYIENWQAFCQIWIIGVLVGAFLIRLYETRAAGLPKNKRK